MVLAVDAYYSENIVRVVSIEFENWQDAFPQKVNEIEFCILEVGEYVPGEFYKRELPGIKRIIEKSSLVDIDTIIIDGYVFLDNYGKKGLGAYLYEFLRKEIPIIGVAKRKFHKNDDFVKEILRGNSKRPLYISSQGISIEEAAENVKEMAGIFRIPSILTFLDRKTKEKRN